MLHTLQSIFTFHKNNLSKVTRYTESYKWASRHEMSAPVRFDAIASAVKKETHKNLYNGRYNEIMKEYDRDL
jgi:hypothetical protein